MAKKSKFSSMSVDALVKLSEEVMAALSARTSELKKRLAGGAKKKKRRKKK